MTVRQRRTSRPPDEGQESHTPSPLPLRWVVILALSVAIGIMVGTTESLPTGMVASLIAAGGLHKIMD